MIPWNQLFVLFDTISRCSAVFWFFFSFLQVILSYTLPESEKADNSFTE